MGYGSSFTFGYGLTPWVKRLLIANAAVFVITWLAPAVVPFLAFTPSQVLFQPWTALTYMFVHAGFFHIFFNMLALFFFGPPLEQKWGSSEFLKYYVICGLGGALLSFVFAFNASVIGASAAVYGVMLAFAMNWPDAPIYIWGIFPIKAKWLILIFVGISLFSAFGGGAGGGGGIAHFAHLGGFAAGFLYLKLDRHRPGPLARLRKLFTRPRLTVVHGEPQVRPPVREMRRPRSQEEERMLDDVDRVLDKISHEGMASLTPEERRLLDDVSRRFRQH